MPELTALQWAVVIVAAVLAVVIPECFKARKARRVAVVSGYRPSPPRINPAAVVFAIIPLTGMLLIWFVVSGFLLRHYRSELPTSLLEMAWVLAFIIDLGVFAAALAVAMPRAYMAYVMNSPTKVSTPLDYLVGLLLAVVFIPGWALHVLFIAGLRSA